MGQLVLMAIQIHVQGAQYVDYTYGTIRVPDCHKQKYMTHETAVLKLRQFRERRNNREEKYIYKCYDCGFYHLTKSPPRRKGER